MKKLIIIAILFLPFIVYSQKQIDYFGTCTGHGNPNLLKQSELSCRLYKDVNTNLEWIYKDIYNKWIPAPVYSRITLDTTVPKFSLRLDIDGDIFVVTEQDYNLIQNSKHIIDSLQKQIIYLQNIKK